MTLCGVLTVAYTVENAGFTTEALLLTLVGFAFSLGCRALRINARIVEWLCLGLIAFAVYGALTQRIDWGALMPSGRTATTPSWRCCCAGRPCCASWALFSDDAVLFDAAARLRRHRPGLVLRPEHARGRLLLRRCGGDDVSADPLPRAAPARAGVAVRAGARDARPGAGAAGAGRAVWPGRDRPGLRADRPPGGRLQEPVAGGRDPAVGEPGRPDRRGRERLPVHRRLLAPGRHGRGLVRQPAGADAGHARRRAAAPLARAHV